MSNHREEIPNAESNRFPSTNGWLAALVALGIIHRTYLFIQFRASLESLVAKSDGWLTWQYFAADVLARDLSGSLWYLQQTPPIPTLLLGLLLKHFSWPMETTLALLVLQYAISILTACGMFLLSRAWGNGPLISWVMSALFLSSLDLVIMEYNSQAQTFYENLSMLLVVVICWQITELLKTQQSRNAWIVGLSVACLALTRASYSYYFLLPFGFLILFRLRSRRKLLFALMLPMLLLHGTWCAKNASIYDTLGLSTSSWLGSNLVSGLDNFRAGGLLRLYIRQNSDSVPEWFSRFVADRGSRNVWLDLTGEKSIPKQYIERDAAIQSDLAGGNPDTNSIARQVVSDLYVRAYLGFVASYPALIADKFTHAYRLFWQPIRDYSGFHFGGLFFVTRLVHSGWDITRFFHFIRSGGSQVHLLPAGWTRLVSGEANIREAPRANTWIGEETGSLVMNAVNLLSLHTLVFGFAVGFLRKLSRGDVRFDQGGFLFGFGSFCYIAIVSNFAEYGENMRFRLSIEPVLWILTTTSWVTLLRVAGTLRAPSSVADQSAADGTCASV